MDCLICTNEFSRYQFEEFDSNEFISKFCDILSFDISLDVNSLNISVKNLFCSSCLNELNEIFDVVSKLKSLQSRIENFKSCIKNQIVSSYEKRFDVSNQCVLETCQDWKNIQLVRVKICKGLSLKSRFPITNSNSVEESQQSEIDIEIKNEEIDLFEDFDLSPLIHNDNESDSEPHNLNIDQDPDKGQSENSPKIIDQLKSEAKRNQIKISMKRLEDQVERDIGFTQITDFKYSKIKESNLLRFTNRPRENLGKKSCKMCDLVFDKNADYFSHMEIHRCEDGLKCPVCDQLYKTVSQLNDHHIIVHQEQKNYKCTLCEKLFSRSNNLSVHMRIHTKEKPYKCQTCNKSFRGVSFLIKHNKKCGENRGKQNCQVCGKVVQKFNFSSHMMIHNNEKNFECSYCDKKFFHLRSLKTHLLAHTGETRFNCTLCFEKFTTKYFLDRHILAIHPESANLFKINKYDQDVSCEVCGKVMKLRNMKEHMMRHNGEKNFICSYCGKSFIKASVLTIHLRTHTGEKPIQCDICFKSFTGRTNLNSHKLIHTGEKKFQCSVCGKAFSQGSTLSTHMVIHSGIRDFQCEQCGMAFLRRNDLKKHLETHNTEKVFLCNLCDASYGTSACLFKHKKNKHEKNSDFLTFTIL